MNKTALKIISQTPNSTIYCFG